MSNELPNVGFNRRGLWVCAYIGLTALVANFVGTEGGYALRASSVWCHGWPMTFLVRDRYILDHPFPYAIPASPFPLQDTSWLQFDILNACVDLALIALLICTALLMCRANPVASGGKKWAARGLFALAILWVVSLCLFEPRPVGGARYAGVCTCVTYDWTPQRLLTIHALFAFAALLVAFVFARAADHRTGHSTMQMSLRGLLAMPAIFAPWFVLIGLAARVPTVGSTQFDKLSPLLFPPFLGATSLIFALSYLSWANGSDGRRKLWRRVLGACSAVAAAAVACEWYLQAAAQDWHPILVHWTLPLPVLTAIVWYAALVGHQRVGLYAALIMAVGLIGLECFAAYWKHGLPDSDVVFGMSACLLVSMLRPTQNSTKAGCHAHAGVGMLN